MFKQILKNLELLLEELRVWWGQKEYMWTSKGRRPWILVLTLHEALWRHPWAWEKAISRWTRREGGNLSELLRVSARYPDIHIYTYSYTAVTIGSSWSAPCHHPSAVWGIGASCSPQYLLPTCPMAGSNSKLSKFCQWPCLRVPILDCLVNI